MSWTNLKKLFPPRNFWKFLKTSLPLRIHKLSKSKANKKPSKTSSCKASKKRLGLLSSLSIQPKKFKTNPKRAHNLFGHHGKRYGSTRPPPVFVDQLFVEPFYVVKGYDRGPGPGGQESSAKERSSSMSGMKKGEIVDQLSIEPVYVIEGCDHGPGPGGQESSGKERSISASDRNKGGSVDVSVLEETHYLAISADDMWESVGMALPQMDVINEKAEEFIARFKAEMRRQEILARRL